MATPEETVGAPSAAADHDGFTHVEKVLADGEASGSGPNPDSSQVDPGFITSKELKEQAEGKKESGKGKGANDLNSTVLISAAVVAVIGAIFAIAKKIREA